MRFVLRQGTREVIFFSENRFVRFEGPTQAADFLLDYLLQTDNVDRLREALGATHHLAWLAQRDEATLLDKTAELLSKGMLRMLSDPEALTPWSWSFESPTFPQEALQSDFEGNALVGDDDEMEENEVDLEDLLPDPIVPPTFIQVADMEAAAIGFLERMFEAAMDLLRWVGMEGELPSELAPAYNQVAASQGNAIDELASVFSSELDPLSNGTLDAVGTTQVGESLTVIAREQGHGVMEMTGDVNELMETLASGPAQLESPTEVGPVLLDTAVSQGAQVAQVTEQAGLALLGLASPDMPELRPTEVGPQLGEIAQMQSDAIAQADSILAEQMVVLVQKGPDAPAVPPTVPAELVNIASSQLVAVLGSTEATARMFHDLVNQASTEPARVSQICQQFNATTSIQVESLSQATDFMGGAIRNMTSVTALEHHDDSPVGEAFVDSALTQTSGMVRAATLAGESLVVLVGGPRDPA
ncbi:MAG: hypothetical protein KC549_02130 [Myxococcales bacterium]|nr:hypothetical protein [Myxococcales bacterium]MCB9548781.1 hypothetical protein [Myxococcales bacterium]